MVASNEQIVALYEGGMSVEELCLAMPDLDRTAIKIALESGSKVYREKQAKSGEVFSSDEYDIARQVLAGLMINSESDQVKYRSAKLILDERLGRRDQKGIKHINFNINLVNQQIAEAKLAEKRALEKVIDVDPEHKHLKEIAA